MKTRHYSSSVLALSGIIMMGLGLYFIFLRPPFLPEDHRYIGTTLAEIQATMPGLLMWLRRVFWVMSGFMFTTGLLTTYLAITAFQRLTRNVRSVIALAGLTSIGWMTIVNFMINSDFKWLLLAFNIPWIASVFLSWRESSQARIANKSVISERYWPCP
ncbi:MAG TPA: hypothetical protein VF918_00085 [Anaerolineales bacterium]